MHWLNIANILPATNAEGPGLRFVIWVQGCLKRCKGCCNASLLKIEPAQIMRSNQVIEQLKQADRIHDLEGITLLGGEPFLQAQGLADIAESAQYLGLSVMVFSGYQLSELVEERFAGCSRLLDATDLLIDGDFKQEKIEVARNWVGSTNQQFHYLTNRYTSKIETQKLIVTNEWRIKLDGKVKDNGLPFLVKK